MRNIYEPITSPMVPIRTQTLPQMQANTAPFVPKSPSPAPSSESAGSSWATVGKASAAKNIDIAPKKTVARRFVQVNQYDERIDEALPQADRMAHTRFTDRLKEAGKARHMTQAKCCNEFHLSGKCSKGEQYCGE